ncbi:hypothetical protein CVT24_006447 [Panaeolus cyanescens]|uniref:Uncharacterized protein n=1 Tax=Panaeolus cyanescens TaxID=181874 RepID=A0A409X3K1_9AGAR|nr:hypothetical protein CVT24_006447 [Panaeolus cyanescens]
MTKCPFGLSFKKVKDRLKSNAQPRKYVEYITLIPRLNAQIANPQLISARSKSQTPTRLSTSLETNATLRSLRFKKEYCLNVSTIPGPKKPDDWDSFLYPLYEELIQLE